MARIPQVTRTITTTVANVLFVNLVDHTTFEKEVTLPRTYKNADAMLKQVATFNEDESAKPVAVTRFYEQETLYGMSEQDFISHAHVMPPRDCKAEATCDATEE